MSKTEIDPKGLIREAYRIDGITPGECRSIFLDWAISAPSGGETATQIHGLLRQYADANPDHPMTGVLKEALGTPPERKRRGGRASRVPDA